MKKSFRGIAPLIITMILIFFISALIADQGEKSVLSYDNLLTAIKEGTVDTIELSNETSTATVRLKGDKKEKPVNIPDRTAFITYAQEALDNGANFKSNALGYEFIKSWISFFDKFLSSKAVKLNL